MRELHVFDTLSERPRGIFAMRGQGDVRPTGVLAGKRPFGFAVPHNIEA